MIVSLWNRTAASVRTVENTPQAPFQGSVLSSYFIPKTSRPRTYISVQSLRLLMSASTISMMSLEILASSPSSISSARLASNSTSLTSSGIRSMTTPSIPIFKPSGFSISISTSGPSMGANASKPSGACDNEGNIFVAISILSSTPQLYGGNIFALRVHPMAVL